MQKEGWEMNEKEFEFQKSDVYLHIIEYISQIYKLTENFPKEELYNLSQQIKRASTSIALNFAEGWGRFNKKEKSQFYKIARASLFECVSILDIAKRLNYIDSKTYEKILKESNILSKRLNGLIQSISKRKKKHEE